MRLRTLLATTAACSMLIAGFTGAAVQAAEPVPDNSLAGPLVGWGDRTDPATAAAITTPGSLNTASVIAVATDSRATAAVTADGSLQVWGAPGAIEVETAPTDVADAAGVAISPYGGVVLRHKDLDATNPTYTVSGWGSASLEAGAPAGKVSAAAIGGSGTAYATNPGIGLVQWGAAPDAGPTPSGLGKYLVDVSASTHQVLVLQADGTVASWSNPAFPAFETVPSFGGQKVTQIATGPTADGVILADGSIRLWGPSVPAGQPDFGGEKVISLSIGATNVGAVTEDGVVHVWGSQTDVNAVPASLAGLPASAISVGGKHAAVIVTFIPDAAPTISGRPVIGQTLTAVPSTFPFTPATGQWYSATQPIEGQTGTTLKVDDSMVGTLISYHSTATRSDTPYTAVSEPVGPVTRAISSTKLDVTPTRASAGKTRTVTATVSRPSGTAGGRVTFTIDKKSRIAIMSGGKAIWKLPNLSVGTHTVTATYTGSPSTAPSTATAVKVNVTKTGSKVSARAEAHRGSATITVNTHTTKRVSARGKVTIKLKGKTKRTIHTKVNARGRATVTIKHLKRGTYKVVVNYAGNKSTKGSKTTKKFKA